MKPHTVTHPALVRHTSDLGGQVVICVTAVFGALLGVYLFVRGFKLLIRKRFIQNIPTSKVRSAALGEVEIVGKAAGPYTIISPVSQTECFYYKATIGETNDRSESLCVPFFVEDETGRLMVDLRGADCELPAILEEQCYVYELGECAQHLAARHGFGPHAFVRISEYCVQASDPLFVLGTLAENPGNNLTPNFQPESAALHTDFLSAEAAAAQRSVMLEMMSVPIHSGKALSSGWVQDSALELNPPVILRKGAGNAPFVVSRQSVKRMVAELTEKSLLYIWGGPILTLVSVAVLLIKLQLW